MSKTIEDLRAHLFDTIEGLRSETQPMDIDRARAVAEVAGQIIQSAKVEVEHLRLTGGTGTGFIETAAPDLPNGINGQVNGIRVHRLQG